MLEIKTWRDPYDAGFSPTRPKQVSFSEGLTVLIGCNGAGKTTLLRNVKDTCHRDNIPFVFYDNLSSGGGTAMEKALYDQDYNMLAGLCMSSEGESIKLNFGSMASKIRKFLQTGFYDSKENRLARIFRHDDKKEITDTRRVLLFDALDSGLSVDSVAEIRKVFDMILEDARKLNMEACIIASANEYELARNAPCFDVAAGKYVPIPDYEAYRSFILKSRERKEKRIQATIRKQERKSQKEDSENA